MSSASSTRRRDRASQFASTYAGKVAELDAAGSRDAMHELAEINELSAAPASFASLRVRHRHRRPRARRAAAARPGARHRDRDEAAVLRARVGRARRRARRAAARHRRARLLPPLPAQRPPLPPAPALRARGEDPRREVDLEPGRLEPAVRRAGAPRCASTSTTRSCRSTSRSAACSRPTARSAATAAEAVSAALEPGLRTRAFIYNTLVHDKSVEDRLRRYPHWLASRNLANEASDESVMALIEAVREPLRHPPALVPAEGASCSASSGWPTTTAPRRCSHEDVTFSFGEARDLVLDTYAVVLAGRRRRSPGGSSTSTGSTRPIASAQARRRVLRLHGPERPPVRDAQLHRARVATC